VQSFKFSALAANFLKNFEFLVISVFRAKKIVFYRNFHFKKLHLKGIRYIVLLAKSQVSGPSGSIFKKFPKIGYTLTLRNQRPAIKYPIGVHYHNVIDICCVDTNFGSTHQRSHSCGQRFGCKKNKIFGQNFFNAIQWRKLTFPLDVRFKRLAGGPNGTHISNTHQ
jgi:hypothetical protein